VVKTLNNNERMQLWLERCAEPMFNGGPEDDVNVLGIEMISASADFDSLLNVAIELEEAECSWEVTIGPAVKAIRRLGRTSAGRDYEKLAAYAKVHQKPSI
jgi:hypothetical protein